MKSAQVSDPAVNVRSLQRRINAVRRRRAIIKVATGIALAAAILPAMLSAETLLDLLVELPWAARACILVGALGLTGFLVWRDAIRPLRMRLHDDAVALMVEHAIPVFRTRFIASLQLSRAHDGPPPSLVRALLAETAAMAATSSFKGVVKTAKLLRLARFAVLAVAVASALAYFGGVWTPLLLKRALLFNISLPRKTHITSVTGDAKLGHGEDLKIAVSASGVFPPHGRVVVTTPSGQTHEINLEQSAAQHDKYEAVVRAVQESFTYRVFLNDDSSDTFHVTTLARPEVAEVSVEQIFPAYVKLPPQKRVLGDLTLLAGSKLRISVKATKKISRGWLRLAGLEIDSPLAIDPNDPTLLSGMLPIPPAGLTGFSIHLTDQEQVASRDTATYRIDLVPDRAPTVKIIYPVRREELATGQATLIVAFEGEDDFAIAKAVCHYTIDQGPEKTIDFDLGPGTHRLVKNRFNWKVPSLVPHVGAGSTIEFWVVVADNNTVTGPGIGTSDHYRVRIVTDAEKRLDISNRLRDTMEGLNGLQQSEQQLNDTLGSAIFEKPKG